MGRRIALCGVSLILIFAQTPVAQELGVGAFSGFKWGVDARALSMAGAVVAAADDYSAVYWNPAGLVQIESLSIGLMNTNKFGQDIGYTFGGTAGSLHWGLSDAVYLHGAGGVGLARSVVSGIVTFGPGGEATGTIDDVESALIGSFAGGVRVGPVELSVARSVRNYSQSLGGESANGWGADYGILLDVSDALAVGFAVSDFGGTRIEWTTGTVDSVAMTARGGFSLRVFDDAVVLAVQRDFGAEMYRWGLELRVVELLLEKPLVTTPLRIGSRIPDARGGEPSMTFGVGISLFEWLNIDAAFVTNQVLGNSLVLSMNAQF